MASPPLQQALAPVDPDSHERYNDDTLWLAAGSRCQKLHPSSDDHGNSPRFGHAA
jgi:hypothetical protein